MWPIVTVILLLSANGQRLSPEEDQKARNSCETTRNLFKIINGEPSSWEEAPWVVRVGGGTGAWISNRHILTASHVVGEYRVNASTCGYAKSSLFNTVAYEYNNGTTMKSITFPTKRRFVPIAFTQVGCEPESEQLKRGTFNDLAILEVEISTNKEIPYAWGCLPQNPLENLTTVHVYGYGLTETGYEPRNSSLRSFNSTAHIVKNSFDLMRFYDSERTACNGDSGGPVIEFGSDGKPIIQALVSTGDFYCDLTKLDQVYTLVHPYMDQICAITGRCKSNQHRDFVDNNLDSILSKFVEIFPRP